MNDSDLLARELATLQAQMAEPKRRPKPAINPAANSAPPPHQAEAATPWPGAEEIGEIVDLIKSFAEDAEQQISEHPAAAILAALVVGILIGRLTAGR